MHGDGDGRLSERTDKGERKHEIGKDRASRIDRRPKLKGTRCSARWSSPNWRLANSRFVLADYERGAS